MSAGGANEGTATRAAPYAAGTKLVRLDSDVAKVFPGSATVNKALRALVTFIEDRSNAA